MLTPLRSALEHLQEMQSYGKAYLCRHELEEDTILNGVKLRIRSAARLWGARHMCASPPHAEHAAENHSAQRLHVDAKDWPARSNQPRAARFHIADGHA